MWVGVGALHEPADRLGISHLLEHMFFKGTRRHPVGAIDRIVKGMGGYDNAATSMEFTHYYIVAPAEGFATAVDLLADHVTDPAFPADELERERQVVKEEIRRKDDAPEGRLYTRLSNAAFGDSPYGHEILGTPDSLDRVDRDALCGWWAERYTGERVVVAIAGAVDPDAAVAAVAEALEGLPAGDGVAAPAAPPPPPPPGEWEERMDVAQAYVAWAFPTAGRADLAELCSLEVAATILGDGMTSRLHRRLIDELRLVTAVHAWTYGMDRAGLAGVDAVCRPDRREVVEAEIAEVVRAAATHGVAAEEVARAKAILAADFAYDNETNAALTGTLGEFEVLYGDGAAFRDVLAGIAAVTAEEASETIARLLDPDRAVRVRVVPDGP